jgi:hypothetical protein
VGRLSDKADAVLAALVHGQLMGWLSTVAASLSTQLL